MGGGGHDRGGSYGSTLERIEGELSSTAGQLAGAANHRLLDAVEDVFSWKSPVQSMYSIQRP